MKTPDSSLVRGTTILSVRHRGQVAVAGDGQVSFGEVVMKHTARNVRRISNDKVIAGFAGAEADAFESGLTPPERVVTTGFVRLTEGSEVAIGSGEGAPVAAPQRTRPRNGQRPGGRPNPQQ